MSTLKTDGIQAATGTNTDLTLAGKGTGVPDLAAGFKVGSVAGVPTASIRDDAVTLAKLAAGTDGELITWDASGDPAAVAVGTATHILTSNGAGAAPTFQAAAGGGSWTHISKATPSSAASVIFSSGFDASVYDCYMIVWDYLPATDNKYTKFYVSTDGGSSYASTSEYCYEFFYNSSNSGGLVGLVQAADDSFELEGGGGVGNAADEGTSGRMFFWSPDRSTFTKFQWITNYLDTSANNFGLYGCGHVKLSSDVDAVKFQMTSGNIASGEVNFYGIKNS